MSDYDDEDIDTETENYKTCYYSLNYACIGWFKRRVPEMSSYRLPEYRKIASGSLKFPQYDLNLLYHVYEMDNSCCFHKLAHMYLNTINEVLKLNKKDDKTHRMSDNDTLKADSSDAPKSSPDPPNTKNNG